MNPATHQPLNTLALTVLDSFTKLPHLFPTPTLQPSSQEMSLQETDQRLCKFQQKHQPFNIISLHHLLTQPDCNFDKLGFVNDSKTFFTFSKQVSNQTQKLPDNLVWLICVLDQKNIQHLRRHTTATTFLPFIIAL